MIAGFAAESFDRRRRNCVRCPPRGQTLKGVGALLLCSLIVGCVLPSTRHAHEQHLAQAEAYKTEFDRQVPRGTALPVVNEYLKTQGHYILNELGEPGTGQALVELFKEKSIRWYCGQGSVGLSLGFVENKLAGTSVNSWSFDCP
jgi:hypothetical protein